MFIVMRLTELSVRTERGGEQYLQRIYFRAYIVLLVIHISNIFNFKPRLYKNKKHFFSIKSEVDTNDGFLVICFRKPRTHVSKLQDNCCCLEISPQSSIGAFQL